MIESAGGAPDSPRAISRAVRFAIAAIVLGLSYPNITCALHTKKFEAIYSDMLPGAPLPAATVWVLQHSASLAGVSILIPVAALASIFLPGVARSIYVSGTLVIVLFAQIFFQWYALTLPLLTIIQGMSASPP